MSPTLHIPGLVRAVVDAGGTSTRYVRAGHGTPVVLLMLSDPVSEPLFAALVARFRVIAPEPRSAHVVATDRDGGAVAFSCWLRDFLDGLGIARVSLVVQEELGPKALGFAMSDPARMSRLTLLFRDTVDPSDDTESWGDLLAQSGQSLLVRRVASTGPVAVDDLADIVRFLADEDELAAESPR